MSFVLMLLAVSPFEAYLDAPFPPAAGFGSPQGRGQVLAMASGRVERAEAGTLVVLHFFYENHQRREVRFECGHLTALSVSAGQLVTPGQPLARGKAKCLIDGVDPEVFREGRSVLPVPQQERTLVLVDSASHQAAIYENGRPTAVFEVGFGQVEGQKQERGDLRTPQGMYFVVDRYKGKFSGAYADYYAGHWVKLSYPNAFDADRGVDAGLITAEQRTGIATAWAARAATPSNTRLGSGIGFHGWASSWDGDAGYGLSWGCIVLHPEELPDFYRRVPLGAMVVLW